MRSFQGDIETTHSEELNIFMFVTHKYPFEVFKKISLFTNRTSLFFYFLSSLLFKIYWLLTWTRNRILNQNINDEFDLFKFYHFNFSLHFTLLCHLSIVLLLNKNISTCIQVTTFHVIQIGEYSIIQA